MKENDPVRVGIIGMGGFAASHRRAIQQLDEAGECRLVSLCDPSLDSFPDQVAGLKSRGVHIFRDYLEMLDACQSELDVVTVPTPVPLHAAMHQAIAQRGLACYLEKPPTLDYAELEEMIGVDETARKLTQVGFNFILEQPRQELKRRLLQGEFGRLLGVNFVGYWPRATSYFNRSSWAGRLWMDARPVLDSCIGNALAHYVHNVLFWCGAGGILSWSQVQDVEAELYRAHSIEGMDTALVRAQCEHNVEVRIAATHAASGNQYQWEGLECERASIEYVTGQGYTIRWADGRQETGPNDKRDLLVENFREYFAYFGGERERPLTRLVDSRPFVHLNDLAYIAAGQIATVAEPHLEQGRVERGAGEWVAIKGIQESLEEFARSGRFPSQQGLPWAQPGGRATADRLPKLSAIVQKMAAHCGWSDY